MIKPLMSGWIIWGMALMGLGVGFAQDLPPRVPDGMSVVVYSVKPDRIAPFEACLRDYEVILGELLREGKLDAQGRRDYDNLRVFKPASEHMGPNRSPEHPLNHFMVFDQNGSERENPMLRYLILSMGKDGTDRWLAALREHCTSDPLVFHGAPF